VQIDIYLFIYLLDYKYVSVHLFVDDSVIIPFTHSEHYRMALKERIPSTKIFKRCQATNSCSFSLMFPEYR